jgi:hypothetical protein
MKYEDDYKAANLTIWDKIIHTKYHYLQLDSVIKRLRRSKVSNFNELKMTNDYAQDIRLLNTIWFAYLVLELLYIKTNLFNLNRRVVFLYPALRICIMSKLYYFYFITKYEF